MRTERGFGEMAELSPAVAVATFGGEDRARPEPAGPVALAVCAPVGCSITRRRGREPTGQEEEDPSASVLSFCEHSLPHPYSGAC